MAFFRVYRCALADRPFAEHIIPGGPIHNDGHLDLHRSDPTYAISVGPSSSASIPLCTLPVSGEDSVAIVTPPSMMVGSLSPANVSG
jgi:hypothetical protein